MIKSQKQTKLLTVPITVTHSPQNKPVLQLRKEIGDFDIIKTLISCAYNDEPVIIYPIFTNKIKSLGTLLDKGLIYMDEKGVYRFTFD
jgi:hypothetical protein